MVAVVVVWRDGVGWEIQSGGAAHGKWCCMVGDGGVGEEGNSLLMWDIRMPHKLDRLWGTPYTTCDFNISFPFSWIIN